MAQDRITRGTQSIAWHPLFPAMLALWFGALFGLGVLAVRVSLLENLALASGIDSILSSAAPPLGMKARILIALALALLGGAIGGTIGMLLARSKPSARARRSEARAAKAARAEAEAPLPAAGEDLPSYFDISALDLGDELRIEPEPFATVEPVIEVIAQPEGDLDAELKPARAVERPADPAASPLPESFPVPGVSAAARLTSATLDSLSHVELIERLALSLQKRREDGAAAPALETAGLEQALAELEPLALSAAAQGPQVPAYYPPAPAAIFEEPEEAEAEEEPAAAYGSLLGIPRAAGDTAAPVALFPEQCSGAARQDSVATERALRG